MVFDVEQKICIATPVAGAMWMIDCSQWMTSANAIPQVQTGIKVKTTYIVPAGSQRDLP